MGEMDMNEIVVKIEKLITNGQKELLSRLDRLEAGQQNLEVGQKNLESGLHNLEAGFKRLDNKIDIVHENLKSEIATTAKVLDYSIKELGEKLDVHMKQPAHA